MKKLEEIIPGFLKEIESIDEDIIIDTASVSQALDLLKKSLDQADELLADREFEKVAQAGYEDIASNFIFLQRVLGALQGSCHKRDALVQDIAAEARLSFEEVWEVVKGKMDSTKPRS